MKSIGINQFLNPESEELDNDLKVIIDEIVKIHETDKINVVIYKEGYFETMKSFQKLWLYEE